MRAIPSFTFSQKTKAKDITGITVKDTVSGKTPASSTCPRQNYSFTYKATMTTGTSRWHAHHLYGERRRTARHHQGHRREAEHPRRQDVDDGRSGPSRRGGRSPSTYQQRVSYSKRKCPLPASRCFPSSKLAGRDFTQTYKRSFEASTAVIFSQTMVNKTASKGADKTIDIHAGRLRW